MQNLIKLLSAAKWTDASKNEGLDVSEGVVAYFDTPQDLQGYALVVVSKEDGAFNAQSHWSIDGRDSWLDAGTYCTQLEAQVNGVIRLMEVL